MALAAHRWLLKGAEAGAAGIVDRLTVLIEALGVPIRMVEMVLLSRTLSEWRYWFLSIRAQNNLQTEAKDDSNLYLFLTNKCSGNWQNLKRYQANYLRK